MIIHVEPETLEEVAQTLSRGVDVFEDVAYDLRRAVGRLETAWTGDDAMLFSMAYRRELNRLAAMSQELDALAARLRRHAAHWQEQEEYWASYYRTLRRGE